MFYSHSSEHLCQESLRAASVQKEDIAGFHEDKSFLTCAMDTRTFRVYKNVQYVT